MCEQETALGSYSYHVISNLQKASQSQSTTKSELNFPSYHSAQNTTTDLTYRSKYNVNDHKGEYYKKYEHDEIPVKDSSSYTILSKYKGTSVLDETHKNVSQELQTDESSFSSLDSNLKFFKSTVEKIFERFYTSMSDFEQYKKRFNDIIGRSKEGTVDDMEDFIKDVFEHIMSSENSLSSACKQLTGTSNVHNADICSSSCANSASMSIDVETSRTFEEYKNHNFPTESTLDDNSSRVKSFYKEDRFNIFLVGNSPSVKIKLDGHNMLSEIQIRTPNEKETDTTASADDLRKLAAKKLELERYIKQPHDRYVPDRDLPVKVSFPKKNIHLDEDFAANMIDTCDHSKSFLTKICSMLCRKFRKNTIG